MQKPNFLIVGVARSGTTSIFHYLQQHPQIFFSKIKEPKFFSSYTINYPHNGPGDKEIYKRIVKTEKEYFDLFKNSEKFKAIGEASSYYFFFHKNSIPLIKKYLGNIKIIICLRNPVDRAFSAYNNLIRDSREKENFYDALSLENQRIKKKFDWMWYYKNGGFYYEGLSAFKSNFSNVKIVFYDEFVENPMKVTNELFDFLEVFKFQPNVDTVYSSSGVPKNLFFKLLSDRTGILVKFREIIIRYFPRNLLEKISKSIFKKNELDSKSKSILKKQYLRDIIKIENLLDVDLKNWK